MAKKTQKIEDFFSFSSRHNPEEHNSKVKGKENIYESSFKRKYSASFEETRQNRKKSPPLQEHADEKDELIKNQKLTIDELRDELKKMQSADSKDDMIKSKNLEIKELREKNDKIKKSQNEMLKMLHIYRLRLLRFEKSASQVNPSQSTGSNYPFEYEFTDEQKKKYFSEWELTQLNSISVKKYNDKAYARKLIEFLYRDDLTALYTRTMRGTSKKGKQPITPSKMDIMKKMMAARGEKATDLVERAERTIPVYITSVLSHALYSVKNTHASKNKGQKKE